MPRFRTPMAVDGQRHRHTDHPQGHDRSGHPRGNMKATKNRSRPVQPPARRTTDSVTIQRTKTIAANNPNPATTICDYRTE